MRNFFALALCSIAVLPAATFSQDHVLISEFVVNPTAGEFIEIYNPTSATVDLGNYYLTDAISSNNNHYINVVGGSFSVIASDFMVKFPDGAMIAPAQHLSVALSGTGFTAEYGVSADFEIKLDDAATTDMMATAVGGSAGLTNNGEVLILFHWDGASDLVQDVDYVVWGDKAEAVDKTGVSIDGPDPDTNPSTYAADTPISQQFVVNADNDTDADPHNSGASAQRRLDVEDLENWGAGGNGITGHDETSENSSWKGGIWSINEAPTPGRRALSPKPASDSLTIADMNFVRADDIGPDVQDDSPFLGNTETITGVFMQGPREVFLGPRWGGFVQDARGGPWSGFFIIQNDTSGPGVEGTLLPAAAPGDLIRVTGVMSEFPTAANTPSITQFALITDPVTPIEFLDTGVAFPEPSLLVPSDFGTAAGGNSADPQLSERWEGTRARFENLTVLVNDGLSGDNTMIAGNATGHIFLDDYFQAIATVVTDNGGIWPGLPAGTVINATGFVRGADGIGQITINPRTFDDIEVISRPAIDFLACLDGAQEVPPPAVMSDARGGGMFTLNGAQDTLTFNVRVCDLTGAITGAHFHNAPPGIPGGVVRAITSDFSGEAASGVWTSSDAEPLTPALVAELLAGNIYVNIHTAANPPGEIRGQLVTSTAVDLSATLDGDQEVPPVTTPANGSGTFTLSGDGSQLDFDITVNDLSGPITSAHFHHAAAGVPGGIVRGITSDFVGNHAMGSWTATDAEPLTAALVAELLAGKIYVNIHTSANPSGEIRGQVLKAAAVEQTIAIQSGTLNAISLNVLPSDLAVETVFDDLGTLVVAQDDEGSFYIPSFSVNTIGDVDVSNGYHVFIGGSVDDAVITNGLPLVPETMTQTLSPTQLSMIGYPYQMAHPVVDVFASIASSVVVVQDDAGQFWIPAFGVNTIGAMQPGKGFQIFVDTPANFTYPVEAALPAASTAKLAALAEPRHFKFEKTGLAYGIVLEASEVALELGDEVGVFDGELCVGASVFAGDYPLVIAAWEGYEEHGLAGFKAGADIDIRVWRASEAEEVKAVASFGDLAESKFRGGPISVMSIGSSEASASIPSRFALYQNYPNPFNPETQIRFDLPEATHVRIVIYNLKGQVIRRLVDEKRDAGSHSISWHSQDEAGRQVASGVYLYRIQAGGFTDAKKVTLLR